MKLEELKKGQNILVGKRKAIVLKNWSKRYPNNVPIQWSEGATKTYVLRGDENIISLV